MANPEQLTEHLQVPYPGVYQFVANLLSPFIWAYGLHHEGAEVLSQIDGPCLVAPVHRSNLDIPAIAKAALEGSDTQLHFMAKQELLKIRGLGKILEWCGAFGIDRDPKILPTETRKHIEGLFEGNAAVVLFPEGTRRTGPVVNPEHILGIHMLAAQYGVPVVTVGVSGTEKGDRGPAQLVFSEIINVPPPDRSWPKVARALKGEITEAMQSAQNRAMFLRAQLL